MAEASGKVLEGVFAIDKPPHLSSAQVLRDLQNHFAPSKTFAPLLRETRAREAEQQNHSKRRRYNNDNVFKMGHGGTLDPLATGVLIVGIGKGTKHLSSFLGCAKNYETVVLFGKGTDSYDVAGKVVAEAPYSHVTRELVEEKLPQFRGNINQVPPIYSALKINGVKAYEYARSGKELPRELESREMEVIECKLLEWYEGDNHAYRWPAEQATDEEKGVARKLMRSAEAEPSHEEGEAGEPTTSTPQKDAASSEPQPTPPAEDQNTSTNFCIPSRASLHTHNLPPASSTPSPAPAARFLLSVSSGFYVRSFAHDLGLACSSLGIMASLIRSRQADFTTQPDPATQASTADNGLTQALPYTDLALGEDVWGPKVQSMLEHWNEKHPEVPKSERIDDRDRPGQWQTNRQRSHGRGGGDSRTESGYRGHRRGHSGSSELKRRRNSSSPER